MTLVTSVALLAEALVVEALTMTAARIRALYVIAVLTGERRRTLTRAIHAIASSALAPARAVG